MKVKCLKKIATKLAGSDICNPDDTVCEVLHKMSDYVKPIPELADVKFIVKVTGSGASYTADKTFAEIKAAHDAGKVIECHYSTFTLHPLMVDNSTISFTCEVMTNSTTAERTTINISANSVGVTTLRHTLTPAT